MLLDFVGWLLWVVDRWDCMRCESVRTFFLFSIVFLFSKQGYRNAFLVLVNYRSCSTCCEQGASSKCSSRPKTATKKSKFSHKASHNANVQQRNPDDFLPLFASSPETNRLDARFAEIKNSSQNDNVNSEKHKSKPNVRIRWKACPAPREA